MALAYLLDPCLQYQNRAGVNNVSGYIEVFRMDTDDHATVYVDFNGTLAPERIGIDNNGRAVMIVESGRPYRVEMHGPDGDLYWTQQPVWTVASGGGVSGTDIVSSDGSIIVDKSTVGSFTTYDLSSNVEDFTDLLNWIRCDGGSNLDGTDIWKPAYSAGTMLVGNRGILLDAGQYYHVTARVRVNKSGAAAYYDDLQLLLKTDDGTNVSEVARKGVVVDASMGLYQDFEISADVLAGSDCELLLEITGKELDVINLQVLDMEVHRVYSGAPHLPPGTLRAEQADWTETDDTKSSFIKHKPDLSLYVTDSELDTILDGYATTQAMETALAGKQDVLTAGSNITIVNNTISATAEPQVNADWNATSGVAEILNKPVIPVVPPLKELVAGTNISITEGADEVTISATAAPQVNADWNATSGVAEILHKPDLSIYAESADLATVATTGSYDDLTDKPTIPAAQVNADWDAVSGVQEILHKPSIPTATSDLQNDSGFITINDVPAQVQTDWDATSGLGQILNKPDLSVYAESADLATVATTGSYDDLLDKPSIPAAQVNADWNAVSGISEILNKPSLATVATTGDYGDLSNTPAIPVIGTITV